MSHGTCETIKVDRKGGGFYIINKTDFDPDKHTEYSADLEPEKPKVKPAKKSKAK